MSLKVGVLTGGGDCPGLNPAIRGLVYRGLDHGFEFVGLEEGWRGLVEGKTLPLGLNEVQHIINQGGTILPPLSFSATNHLGLDRLYEFGIEGNQMVDTGKTVQLQR